MGCFRTCGIASQEAEQRDGSRGRGRRARRLGSSASPAAATLAGDGPGSNEKALSGSKAGRGGAAAAACRRMAVGMRALNLIFSEARRSLSLTFSGRAPRTVRHDDEGKARGRVPERDSENNKSWLLADAQTEQGEGGVESVPFSAPAAEAATADPHSVHSSFRFSFGSQLEVEPTVLMVSEDEQPEATPASTSRDHTLLIKWRRLESLERSISPVTGALVRFSFSEISFATRDFHPGLYQSSLSLSLTHSWCPADSEFVLTSGFLLIYAQGGCWGGGR